MKERPPWVSRVLVVVLVVAGIAVGLFTFLKQRSQGGGQFHPDYSFVAITENGKLEIRDSRTGDLHRLLREDLAAEEFDEAHITVSPDGRYAYHDAAITRCKGRDVRAIARVDLVRSFTQLFVAGRAPALSPDGSKLAYLAPSSDGKVPSVVLDGERPVCADTSDENETELLVVRSFDSGIEQRSTGQFEPFGPPIWTESGELLVPGGGEDDYSFVSALTGEAKPAPDLDGLRVLAVAGPGEFIVATPVNGGCSIDGLRLGRSKTRLERSVESCDDVRYADVHDDGKQILVGSRTYMAAAWLPNEPARP